MIFLSVLPVCCLGRTSKGLWDQLSVETDSLIRTNVKKITLSVNNIDKMKVLEGDKGFWGKILKMGMNITKTKQIVKQSKRTLKRAKTIKLKKRENKPR